MVDMGFEIGLHFDPSVYESQDLGALENSVGIEAEVLSHITGEKVRSVSLHSPTTTGRHPLFKSYNNAYDKRIYSSKCYLSDSRLTFRHDPYKFVKKATKYPIQILLHPMHYSEEGFDYKGIFKSFFGSFLENVDNYYRLNEVSGISAFRINFKHCFRLK